MICGSHIDEYVTATNMKDRVGDSITRTIKAKKANIVSPAKKLALCSRGPKVEAYTSWHQDLS